MIKGKLQIPLRFSFSPIAPEFFFLISEMAQSKVQNREEEDDEEEDEDDDDEPRFRNLYSRGSESNREVCINVHLLFKAPAESIRRRYKSLV